MKLKQISIAIVLFFTLMTFNCFALPSQIISTGNDFYSTCKDMNRKPVTPVQALEYAVKVSACYSIARTAFDDVINIGYLWQTSPKAILCFHKYHDTALIPLQQILNMTMRYIRNHPEHGDLSIGTNVAGMIKESFPFPESCMKLK